MLSPLSAPKVLIVDDEEMIRKVTTILLDRIGCTPLQASNGKDGEFMALETNPRLILLDIMMPDQDGFQTCRNLRAQGYTGTIVMISALSPEIGKQRALDCGANDFLQKPVTQDVLRAYVNQLPDVPLQTGTY
jgi:DNA-binding response OmpR family regulator